jgi:hypothetical protein
MARHINNDCKRAALIYFKDNVSPEQAADALRQIAHVLKPAVAFGEESPDAGNYVTEYDPEWGEPVWYIP